MDGCPQLITAHGTFRRPSGQRGTLLSHRHNTGVDACSAMAAARAEPASAIIDGTCPPSPHGHRSAGQARGSEGLLFVHIPFKFHSISAWRATTARHKGNINPPRGGLPWPGGHQPRRPPHTTTRCPRAGRATRWRLHITPARADMVAPTHASAPLHPAAAALHRALPCPTRGAAEQGPTPPTGTSCKVALHPPFLTGVPRAPTLGACAGCRGGGDCRQVPSMCSSGSCLLAGELGWGSPSFSGGILFRQCN